MPDEYISREAMLEHLDRCKQSEDATTLTAAVITALQCFVQSQPAADVSEVVRCRDCDAWKRNVGIVDSPNGHCFEHNIDTNGQDFCSWGATE